MYDVSNRSSFDGLEYWIVEADTYCTQNDVVKMLIANKIDTSNRMVPREEGNYSLISYDNWKYQLRIAICSSAQNAVY